MASPLKSLSIREGAEGYSIHKNFKKGTYKSIADFWFNIDCFVKFEEVNFSGYIFDVHKKMGEDDISK